MRRTVVAATAAILMVGLAAPGLASPVGPPPDGPFVGAGHFQYAEYRQRAGRTITNTWVGFDESSYGRFLWVGQETLRCEDRAEAKAAAVASSRRLAYYECEFAGYREGYRRVPEGGDPNVPLAQVAVNTVVRMRSFDPMTWRRVSRERVRVQATWTGKDAPEPGGVWQSMGITQCWKEAWLSADVNRPADTTLSLDGAGVGRKRHSRMFAGAGGGVFHWGCPERGGDGEPVPVG